MGGGEHQSGSQSDPPQSTDHVLSPQLEVHPVYFALAQLSSFSTFSLADPEVECHRNNPPQTLSQPVFCPPNHRVVG